MILRFFSFAFIVPLIIAVPVIADTVVEEIVARVNSEIITRSEFQRSRNQLLNESKDKYGAQVDPTTKKKDVLRDLIDQALLAQKGKDLEITGDTDLIKRLNKRRRRRGWQLFGDTCSGK